MSQALKIESIIKRPGGTRVTIGANAYHFAPETADVDAAHVAIVADMGDVQKFLAVAEGFRLIGTADTPAAQPAQAPAPVATVSPTPVAPAQSVQDKADAPADADDLAAKSLEDLQAIYTAETGLKPHHKTSAATLIEKITENRAAVAAASVQPLGATPSA